MTALKLSPGLFEVRSRVNRAFQRSLLWGLPLGWISMWGLPAIAITFEMKVLPLLNETTGNCPTQLIAHETLRPYFEGGFARDGMVKLQDIATNVRLLSFDAFSTTWVADLKPEYRTCQASAIIDRMDGEVYSAQSHLEVRLFNGQAEFRLDMTGMQDANGFTTVITERGMRDGNPRWTWGGTD